MTTNEVKSAGERALAVEAATLHYVLRTALDMPELVAEFDRLAGTNIAGRGSPLDRAIDTASGRADADLQAFLAFAKDAVWDRLDHATLNQIRAQVAMRHAD